MWWCLFFCCCFVLVDSSNCAWLWDVEHVFPSYFAWLQSACYSSCHIKQLTDHFCFGFEKPIIWAKKRLIGLRSHGKPVLIAQDIMVVTHPQVGVVNTPTMIMTNLQRNTVPRMNTTNNATPPPQHHETTVTTVAAALADTALLVTPQRIPEPPAPPGHIPKTQMPAPMAETPHLHKDEAVRIPAPPRQVPGTQANSPETQPLVITMALGDGARDPKENAQPPEGRTPLQPGLNHSSSSPLRAMLGSSGQVVRASL